MKIIIAIIILIGIFNSEVISQRSEIVSKCDTLLIKANKQIISGCGENRKYRKSYLQQAVTCYVENGEIDKAIELAEDNIRDIYEEFIGSLGWTKRLIKYEVIKYGEEFVLNHLTEINPKMQIEEFADLDSLMILPMLESGQIIYATVKVFGKDYGIWSRPKDKDFQICKDFIFAKISKKDLEEYFAKRWRESLMYKEIEKIK